jgi:hypothetical protein
LTAKRAAFAQLKSKNLGARQAASNSARRVLLSVTKYFGWSANAIASSRGDNSGSLSARPTTACGPYPGIVPDGAWCRLAIFQGLGAARQIALVQGVKGRAREADPVHVRVTEKRKRFSITNSATREAGARCFGTPPRGSIRLRRDSYRNSRFARRGQHCGAVSQGINQNLYYRWKDFLKAGKRRRATRRGKTIESRSGLGSLSAAALIGFLVGRTLSIHGETARISGGL